MQCAVCTSIALAEHLTERWLSTTERLTEHLAWIARGRPTPRRPAEPGQVTALAPERNTVTNCVLNFM